MKKLPLTSILCLAVMLSLGTLRSQAATTETVSGTTVVNSTATFNNVGVSGPGNLSLDQTSISASNLNSSNPPVTLQLTLANISYTEASVTGDGQAPTITFTLTPTLGNVVSQPAGQTVTLTAPVIANGVTETNVIFTNSSPVVFAAVPESNPGNTNHGSGTWQESLSNLEPHPDAIVTANGVFVPGSVQNSSFSFDGSVEVFYEDVPGAVPEPSAWRLDFAATAVLGLSALLFRRRGSES